MKRIALIVCCLLALHCSAMIDIAISVPYNGVTDTLHWYYGFGEGADSWTFGPSSGSSATCYNIYKDKTTSHGITVRLGFTHGAAGRIETWTVLRVVGGSHVVPHSVTVGTLDWIIESGGSRPVWIYKNATSDIQCTISVNHTEVYKVTNLTGQSIPIYNQTLQDGCTMYVRSTMCVPHVDNSLCYLEDGTQVQKLGTVDGKDYLGVNGNIVIKKDITPTITPAQVLLVYAKLKGGADEGKLLFGSAGLPLYSKRTSITTNVMINTEWVFVQDDYNYSGNYPRAIINGEVVCAGHTTTHIIDYAVGTLNWEAYSEPIDFSMSIQKASGAIGGSCIFRCWDSNYATYDECPAQRRASVVGNDATIALFRAQYDIASGSYTLTTR